MAHLVRWLDWLLSGWPSLLPDTGRISSLSPCADKLWGTSFLSSGYWRLLSWG